MLEIIEKNNIKYIGTEDTGYVSIKDMQKDQMLSEQAIINMSLESFEKYLDFIRDTSLVKIVRF